MSFYGQKLVKGQVAIAGFSHDFPWCCRLISSKCRYCPQRQEWGNPVHPSFDGALLREPRQVVGWVMDANVFPRRNLRNKVSLQLNSSRCSQASIASTAHCLPVPSLSLGQVNS